MKQPIYFKLKWKLSKHANSTTLLLSICLLFSACATKYGEYYVAPSYFFTLPQSKQKVSKNLIVVHGANKSYYLLQPKMTDSAIFGKLESIADTSNEVFKQTISYAKVVHQDPIYLFTSKTDSAIQYETKAHPEGQIKLGVTDLKSVKLRPYQSVATSTSPNKSTSSVSAGGAAIVGLFSVVLVVMIVIITFSMLARPACYIATMVYKSYDATEVLILRKFRDEKLLPHWWGKCFVAIYYASSPLFVKVFKRNERVHLYCKFWLDKLVSHLIATSDLNSLKLSSNEDTVTI